MRAELAFPPGYRVIEPTIRPNGVMLPPPPPPLVLIRPSSLAGKTIPEREWIVRNWIPSGVVTGIYGNGGEGKTLVAQQLQTSTAVNQSWLGQETEPVRSLGFYCEDEGDELHRRQNDINRYYNCTFEKLDDAVWIPRGGMDNLLMVFGSQGRGELTPLHAQLVEAACDHKARLVIVDPVAETFGGNENNRSHVRQYVSYALGSIARKIKGSVVALAHPSRAGIQSGDGDGGSTDWSNAFRSRLFLTTPKTEEGGLPDANARVLQRKKANYAARDDEISLRWRDGVLITDAPPGFGSTFGSRPVEDVFLTLLDILATEDRPLSAIKNSSNFAPAIFSKRPEREGYKRPDFERAMETLFARGAIANVEYGRKSDERRKIVRSTKK